MGHTTVGGVVLGALGFLAGAGFQRGVHFFEGLAAPAPPPPRQSTSGCELAERCLLRLEASLEAQWTVTFQVALGAGSLCALALVLRYRGCRRTQAAQHAAAKAATSALALEALHDSDEELIPVGYLPPASLLQERLHKLYTSIRTCGLWTQVGTV